MERKYAILRDLNRAFTGEPSAPRRGAFGPGVLDAREAVQQRLSPPEPRIDVESLRPKDVRDLAGAPEVVSVAPVMPIRLVEPIKSKAKATQQAWGIGAVGADVSSFTGAGVTVAVLDTGIDATHPAFEGVNLVQADFTGTGDGDEAGHGTHCAGTIFGREVDNIRIGVAPGIDTALIGKVLDGNGSGSSDMLFAAIQWAGLMGARVISMSLGFDFPGLVNELVTNQGVPVPPATSLALEAYRGNLRMFDALMGILRASQAFGPGTVVIAAAGNESERPSYEIAASLPAAAEGVVSVAALERRAVGSGSHVLLEHPRPDQRAGPRHRVGPHGRWAGGDERHQHGLPPRRGRDRAVVGVGDELRPAPERAGGDQQAPGHGAHHRSAPIRRRGRPRRGDRHRTLSGEPLSPRVRRAAAPAANHA